MSAFETGRYERKYVVPEATAEAIRKFVSAYLIPDPYMTAGQSWGYQVHSLYLDTRQLALYRQTAEGIKNRFKLRIRFYNDDNGPAFLEVKSRNSETIFKQRAAVTRRAAESLIRGGAIGTADLLIPNEKTVPALAEFCERMARLNAQGAAFVSFWREAYVLPHAEGARVTFDRQIVGQNYRPGSGLTIPAAESVVASNGVVLELKYMGRAPGWMKDLVGTFGLSRISFPKYVQAIDALHLAPALAG